MTFAFDVAPSGCTSALNRLAGLGFNEAGVRERLGLADLNDLQMKAVPIYRQDRLLARDPLDLAIELFVLQGHLAPADLARLFPGGEAEDLARAGVLETREGRVRARVSLYPAGRTLIFSDHAWPQLDTGGGSFVPYDQVMYVGTDSRWLARTTVRRPVASALDLCCGSGIHALLAARHAGKVTAVDINPRAVACTAFNARAQGLLNLEALQGDLYAPVGERTFDLITANPPFVPAPAQEVGFRDGGASGEDVQRCIVSGLPRHLAKGGLAQIVTELGERDGEPLERRLRQWLEGAPMDIHILRLRIHAAQVYAMGHADGDDYVAFLDSVGRWYANLKAQGYVRVVSVLLAFQWSQGTPWTRQDEAHAPARDASADLEAAFAAESLARDPGLKDRLRQGRIVRCVPVALMEAQALGAQGPPQIQALAGTALPVEHDLQPMERDLLGCMDQPVATADLLAAAAKAAIPEEAVLDTLVGLVRKGLASPRP